MSGNDSEQFDVVIVGGGMVGATMAALLDGLPVQVGLVDRGPWETDEAPAAAPETFDPRVSALTAASKSALTELGVWPDIAARRCCPYREMHVWDADGTGSIHFSAADINETELGTVVENSVVMAALRTRLENMANLRILPQEEVVGIIREDSAANPDIRLNTRLHKQLQTKLLIAADGANSPIRQLAGFRTREWDYGHEAIVTTVRCEQAHHHTAWQRFMDAGPLAFLPLLPASDSTDQHYCSIVWSAMPARAQQLMALSDVDFCRQLGFSFEQRLGRVEGCDNRYSFLLRQRHAIDYVQPGIALIGDAAHTIHPLAGQGVNLGLLDAIALASELRRALQVGRELGDETVLRRYQRARVGHNLSMMWLMEGFKHLFANQALPLRWLRNMGMSGVDKLSVVKNQLARRAMGLDIV